jgi:hypothetical protein
MEAFQEYRAKAIRHADVADHLLQVTIPVIHDPKILLTVLDNLHESMLAAIDALLSYEVLFKRINVYGEAEEERLRMFKHVALKHEFDPKYGRAIEQLRELVQEHKKSPMEFGRKGELAIMTEQGVTTLSSEELKKYVPLARTFITEIDKVISHHEGLFR